LDRKIDRSAAMMRPRIRPRTPARISAAGTLANSFSTVLIALAVLRPITPPTT